MISAVGMGSQIFGTLVRARKAARRTQEQIAERIGIRRENFSRMECGHTEPSLDLLCRWAEAVNVRLCAEIITSEPAA